MYETFLVSVLINTYLSRNFQLVLQLTYIQEYKFCICKLVALKYNLVFVVKN
jgi:hypothetical protein